MIYTACRRTSDGLIMGLQVNKTLPPIENFQIKLDSYETQLGGTWEQFQLTEAAYNSAQAEITAGNAVKASGEHPDIVLLTTDTMTLEISDISGTAYTLTCDTGDNLYTGNVEWTLVEPVPNGAAPVIQTDNENAVSGVSTCLINVGKIGKYKVTASAPGFGHRTISFEVQ